MKLKRTLFIVTGCAAFAAWFSAAMTPSRRPPSSPDLVRSQPVEMSGAALARETARLHERLRPDIAPRAQPRNLFAFQAPPRRLAVVPRAAPVAPESPAPVAGPALTLTLAGLAEDPVTSDDIHGDVVRTAIITGRGQLFLVKEGEAVVDGEVVYTVGPITADGVELTDRSNGRVRRLELKRP